MRGVWVIAALLVLAGAVLVLTDIRDIWLAREFWRDMRRPGPDIVPAFRDNRYLTAELTLLTAKIVGGSLLGLAGLALAALALRRSRARS